MVLYHDMINITIKNQIGVQHMHFSELRAPAAALLLRTLTPRSRRLLLLTSKHFFKFHMVR